MVLPLSVLCLAVVAQAAPVLIPAPPQLAAKSWILMDANTGRVLVEENANQSLPPASLTKMMSSYVVSSEMAKNKFNEDTLVPISVTAWKMGGSKMFVREGTEVAVKDLLRGLIIQSGNDATVALAEFVAGAEGSFADVMNQYASLLGMSNSHFVNATGWPAEGHVTTAHDLAILARALIQDHPEHYKLYAEKQYTYNNIAQRNRNLLLWRDKSVDGVKTGHTEEAGYCLVSSALRDGMRLVAVVMGASSEEARARESSKLLSYGFRYYETAKIYQAGAILKPDVRVWFGKDDNINLVAAKDLYLTLPRGARDDLDAVVHVDDVVRAPLTSTGELGTLTVTYQGETLLKESLVADHAVAEAGFFARIWDHLLLLVYGLFS
ncbi:MAG: D-alanyl-D-alanine carboxypeptidase [Porticoccaceae bacterium]|nr:D-alanyl-D-alanine carboxypeptidase [Porticoccaceae bacterium]